MPTIGRIAAQKISTTLPNLVKILNKRAQEMGHTSPWMNSNGSLTDVGRSVYQHEKEYTGTKTLQTYIESLQNRSEKLIEPFKTLLSQGKIYG